MAGLVPEGGVVPRDGGLRQRGHALLDDLAARFEARAERIAADVASALMGGFSASATTRDELVRDTQAFVYAIANCLRRAGRRVDPLLLERWRALGRRGAAENVSLSRLVEALEVEAEIVIAALVEEWSTLSPAGRTIEAYLMCTTMALTAQRLAAVTEAYLDTCLQRRSGRRWATEQQVAELMTPELTPAERMEKVVDDCTSCLPGVGFLAASAYMVVAVVLTDSDWSVGDESLARLARQVESSSTALWAKVGRLGVLIVPVTDDDASAGHDAVEMLCAVAGDHIPDARLLMASTGPHPGPAGVQHGFELVRCTLEVAERLGWRGVLRPGDVLVPALLVSAPHVAGELADLVRPLTSDGHSERGLVGTLRQHLASGLSVEATSRALGVHPSTVRARLGRVERLVGGRVADQATALHLACLASDLGLGGGSVVATDDTGRGDS